MRTSIAAVSIASVMVALPAKAQEVRLRLHHFLPAAATIQSEFIEPWARRVEAESDNRIKIDIFPFMQLGGKPRSLIDQLRQGTVDIVGTRPGFTPDRFPKTEVFELPFLSATSEPTSKAFWEFYETNLIDEYRDFKVLATWVHGPSYLHVKGKGVRKIDEIKGLKLSFPTGFANRLIQRLGAIPVGLPPDAVPAALSKGILDGAVLPWEATMPGRIPEIANTHTIFSGGRGFATATFILAMNQSKFAALPDDLKAVIDKNSGIIVSAAAGSVMDAGGARARKAAVDRKNDIVTLDAAETERWQLVARIVEDNWVSEMTKKGFDAKVLIQQARDLVAKHSSR